MRRAADDRKLLGTSLYSYAIPVKGNRTAFLDRLRQELWSDGAPAPTFAWKTQPQTGYIARSCDSQRCRVSERFAAADGSGWRGAVGYIGRLGCVWRCQPRAWNVEGRREVRTKWRGTHRSRRSCAGASGASGDRRWRCRLTAVEPNEIPVGAQADRSFGDLWNRTDLPVAQGKVKRSWLWGPQKLQHAERSLC